MLFKGQSAYISFALQTMHCKSKWWVATSWICYALSNHRSTECTCSIYLTTRKITFVIIDLKKVGFNLFIFLWLEHAPRGRLRVAWRAVASWSHESGFMCNTWAQTCHAAMQPLPFSLYTQLVSSHYSLPPSREPKQEKCTVHILMKKWCRVNNRFVI